MKNEGHEDKDALGSRESPSSDRQTTSEGVQRKPNQESDGRWVDEVTHLLSEDERIIAAVLLGSTDLVLIVREFVRPVQVRRLIRERSKLSLAVGVVEVRQLLRMFECSCTLRKLARGYRVLIDKYRFVSGLLRFMVEEYLRGSDGPVVKQKVFILPEHFTTPIFYGKDPNKNDELSRRN